MNLRARNIRHIFDSSFRYEDVILNSNATKTSESLQLFWHKEL